MFISVESATTEPQIKKTVVPSLTTTYFEQKQPLQQQQVSGKQSTRVAERQTTASTSTVVGKALNNKQGVRLATPQYKVKKIPANHENVKAKEGFGYYESLRKRYEATPHAKAMIIGYIISHEGDRLYFGGSEAGRNGSSYHSKLGTCRPIDHSLNLINKSNGKHIDKHDGLYNNLIQAIDANEKKKHLAQIVFTILHDLRIPMQIFEACLLTAIKCHPNGAELRKKVCIGCGEIVRNPADIAILPTATHEMKLGAFFIECMGIDYDDFNLNELKQQQRYTGYEEAIVQIDLTKTQMPMYDIFEGKPKRNDEPAKAKPAATADKNFKDPAVNIARIKNSDTNASTGEVLYNRLKALYANTTYGNGLTMSIFYKLTHTRVELYIGGSEARTDSRQYIPLFGTSRIPAHFRFLKQKLNGQNAGLHDPMYTQLVESIDNLAETYPTNFECTVLRDIQIPSTIAEACVYSYIKNRPDGHEVRKRLCISRCEIVTDPRAKKGTVKTT